MAEAEHQGPECVPPVSSVSCLTVTSTQGTTITTTSLTPCTTSTSTTHHTTLSTSNTSSSPATSSSGASETSKKRFNIREALSEVKTLMDVRGTGGDVVSWEERCHGLHRHYLSLFREYKKQEKKLVECQKKQLEVSQHRDVIQTEYARVNMAKGKLESLCRELQRHSKAVAEESRQRQREDEDRRKEVSAKFQTTINDITHKMQEHHQHNQTLRQENIELMTKLKQISEQYEAREEHCERLLKQKQLELQLLEAKMAQQMVAVVQEKESSLAERQYLLAETVQQQKKCELLTHQELELRGQLAMYSDKFEEFQQTLTKSNHVFSTFKKDTDRMAKTIGSLEKEVTLWKARCEKVSKTLMDATEERAGSERAMKTLRTKTEKLERLCRALQAERNTLRAEIKTLEENGRVSPAQLKSREAEESSHVDEGASGTEPDSAQELIPLKEDKIEALAVTDAITPPHPPLDKGGVVSGEVGVASK